MLKKSAQEEFDQSPFDRISRINGNGETVWHGRELMLLLGYKSWQTFGSKESGGKKTSTICRAFLSCQTSGEDASQHFHHLCNRISGTGQGSREDWRLSRLACYLIAMNGDITKPEIAQAQRYFAAKTREAELAPVQHQIPQTYLEALKAAVAAEERAIAAENQRLILQAQIQADLPATRPVDRCC